MCSKLLTWTAMHNLSFVFLTGPKLISVNVKSVNASEGMQVRFACQTLFSQDDVSLSIVPTLPPNATLQGQSISLLNLPDGGHEIAMSFTATASVNETIIKCRAFSDSVIKGVSIQTGARAKLLVQGKGSLR